MTCRPILDLIAGLSCVLATLGLADVLSPSAARAAAGPPPACAVESLAPIVPATAGFSVSPTDDNLIVFSKPVGKTMQVFRFDRRTKQETCLTCAEVSGGPSVDRHKGAPSFLADGKRLVLQVEMAQHPHEGQIGGPGAGWFNDVWMTTLEGGRWWNLTRYPSGANDRFGVLVPEPSPDGRRLAWAELYADDGAQARMAVQKSGQAPPGSAPWGRWRIKVADLVPGPEGSVALGNARTITLPNATWYETQGWSRDGDYLIFATDAGLSTPQAMDLWVHNFNTGRSANLTRSQDAWEEFGDISPSGKLVAFMSSTCCAFKPTDDKKKLRTELYLTTPDRAFTERLTYFNDPSHKDGKDGPGGSVVTKLRWSRDGSKIYFERPFYGTLGAARGSYLMELTFAGACGSTDPSASPGGQPDPSGKPNQRRSELPAVMRLGGAPIDIVGNVTVRVAGHIRSYRAAIPKVSPPAAGFPVVVAFHGFGDTKDLMPLYSGLDDLARRHGALVVYPQSRPGAWPLVLEWAKPDFAFFDALLDDLDRRYRIDRSRIFVAGMSNGGYFTHLLASQRASVIAAIAPHSGGLGAVALGTVPVTRRFPVMIIHGAADNIVKIDEARKAKAYYEKRGHEVRYIEVSGLGHAWALRGQTQSMNDQIWSFLASHPLR